ncbi:putative ATP-binding cassette transporter [Mycena olivaceomarginata]|nr:putative ATP-binding cassette transporter [Mycena olivaceomarginata]
MAAKKGLPDHNAYASLGKIHVRKGPKSAQMDRTYNRICRGPVVVQGNLKFEEHVENQLQSQLKNNHPRAKIPGAPVLEWSATFGISAAFGVIGLSSAVLSAYWWTRTGRVALALEENVESEHESGQSSIQASVFDIATPDDFIDGHPIDEVAFVARTRSSKVALLVVLTAVVFIASASARRTGYSESTQIVFAAYLAFLAALSLRTLDRSALAYYTTTLAVLTTGAFLILLADSLVPSPLNDDVSWMQLLPLVLYLAASALALTTPRGPGLYYISSKIYPQKIYDSAAANNPVAEERKRRRRFVCIQTPPPSASSSSPTSPKLQLSLRASVSQTFRSSPRTCVPSSPIRASARASAANQLRSSSPGMRFGLAVLRANAWPLFGVQLLSALTAAARYAPSYFMRLLLLHLEDNHSSDSDGTTRDKSWGYVYVAGLFASWLVSAIAWGQLWNLAHIVGIRISTPHPKTKNQDRTPFAHKGQILTLMSQDVNRVADLSKHVYTLIDSPMQLVLGTWLLYSLLGVSCFAGLAATLVLGGIRMIKEVELRCSVYGLGAHFRGQAMGDPQAGVTPPKITYIMKTVLAGVGDLIPLLFALVSFGHYYRRSKSSAHTSPLRLLRSPVGFELNQNLGSTDARTVFVGLTYSISAIPEAFLAGLQCLVSLRRVDQYLDSPEVSLPISASLTRHANANNIFLSAATVTWPSATGSYSTIRFALFNLTLNFPAGELSLVCGKAIDNISSSFSKPYLAKQTYPLGCLSVLALLPISWRLVGGRFQPPENWVVADNILFELPYCAERYAKTLEVSFELFVLPGSEVEFNILRRASILILDDILSAVDVHTAHHIYHTCLKGEIIRGRTVILVSHHIRLCAEGAAYIVALDRGTAEFQGRATEFRQSEIFRRLLQTKSSSAADAPDAPDSQILSTSAAIIHYLRRPRRPKEEMKSAPVGRIPWGVWTTYLGAVESASMIPWREAALLNRFGKDLQIIDGFIADDFGRALKLGLSAVITFITITFVGGLPFLCAASVLGLVYYLLSTTTSPLYSIYDTAISGVVVIRAFGGSTTFLRDLMRCVDMNSCACHWQFGMNRWFSGLVVLLSPTIDPSLAGLALAFASMISFNVMYFVRAFVGLEQCLPDLPHVLHGINFQVLPGEKVFYSGIFPISTQQIPDRNCRSNRLGKSTLALSFFRFVEASKGQLLIDDIDIATLGLTDLRRNLTIIPQDPTLLSGTLRSTLDVVGEHQDAEIFEALRRVHLISDASKTVFSNLDSPVSQGGDNFSAGEKQLLCMARAILRHSKVLIIDEATASVDYATDELIGGTIREIFSQSTVIAIAHRLRSIIDYDKVMVLEEGRIVEFDKSVIYFNHPYFR